MAMVMLPYIAYMDPMGNDPFAGDLRLPKTAKNADPGTAAYCGKCQSQLQPLFAIISIRQLG